MRLEQYAALEEWFDRYVAASHRESPGLADWIRLKDEHTRRVVDNISAIGRSLALPDGDLLLARSVALLHDVGRFAQIGRYGTFNDRRSEDHAALGVRVLDGAGVLAALPRGEAELIAAAVGLHNRRDLPEGLDRRVLLMARLIQDADKLDILALFTRLHSGEDGEFGAVLDAHLPDTPGFTAALVEDVLAGRLGAYRDVHNRNDRKLLHLSWVFDIHFDHTLAMIKEGGFVEKTVGVLPEAPEVRAVHRLVKAFVDARLRARQLPQITC